MNIAAIYPIKPGSHPNVSLIADDEVLFAFEEEKLSSTLGEHTPGLGLCAALSKAALRPDQIDIWALVGKTGEVIADFTSYLKQNEFIHFIHDLEINRVSHPLSHASLSVFTSPFDECLFASMDHSCDDGFAVMGVFKRNLFHEIHRSTGFHLADFLSDISQYLGFGRFEQDALVSLAAYGKVDKRLYRHLQSIIHVSGDGMGIVYTPPKKTVRRDLTGLNWAHLRLSGAIYPCVHFSSIPYIREVSRPDVAATAQKLAEDYIVEMISTLVKKTGMRRVAASGCLFQNSRLNAALHEMDQVEAIHVPFACGDAGLSLGAALYTLWEKNGRRPRAPLTPYLGPCFDPEIMEQEIKTFGLRYRRTPNVSRDAARLIAEGMVVGWFQEGAEYGPRALGARSVLADPRKIRTRDRIGPFADGKCPAPHALSILEERLDDFFHHACKIPYMNITLKIREEKGSLIPAGVHVDGSSLPQTVGRSQNRRLYELIEEFRRLTGIPAVLNASFDRKELPPVCTPRQALEQLCTGAVDFLAMGDFLVERQFVRKEYPLFVDSHSLIVGPAMPAENLALKSV